MEKPRLNPSRVAYAAVAATVFALGLAAVQIFVPSQVALAQSDCFCYDIELGDSTASDFCIKAMDDDALPQMCFVEANDQFEFTSAPGLQDVLSCTEVETTATGKLTCGTDDAGTPGGSANSVQYNNTGVFGGFGSWLSSLLTIPGRLLINPTDPSVSGATASAGADDVVIDCASADCGGSVLMDDGQDVVMEFKVDGSPTSDGVEAYMKYLQSEHKFQQYVYTDGAISPTAIEWLVGFGLETFTMRAQGGQGPAKQLVLGTDTTDAGIGSMTIYGTFDSRGGPGSAGNYFNDVNFKDFSTGLIWLKVDESDNDIDFVNPADGSTVWSSLEGTAARELTWGDGTAADQTLIFNSTTDDAVFWDQSADCISVTDDLCVPGQITTTTPFRVNYDASNYNEWAVQSDGEGRFYTNEDQGTGGEVLFSWWADVDNGTGSGPAEMMNLTERGRLQILRDVLTSPGLQIVPSTNFAETITQAWTFNSGLVSGSSVGSGTKIGTSGSYVKTWLISSVSIDPGDAGTDAHATGTGTVTGLTTSSVCSCNTDNPFQTSGGASLSYDGCYASATNTLAVRVYNPSLLGNRDAEAETVKYWCGVP